MSTHTVSTELVTRTGDWRPTRRDERGMTTAEYAVGTVAAASFAGVLIKILTDEQLRELILRLILAVISAFMKTPTIL
ncbi:MAG: DUF4244 domain-containing protein [Propionibacteriaceae bacterium]|nr:DUF4244 domain-containing protein [Propionibacteriaceae bacterium]